MNDFMQRRESQLAAEVSQGRIRPDLTFVLTTVRTYFGVEFDRNSVIDHRPIEGYLPLILPNGDMFVASDALTDFKSTFEPIGIDTDELLVLYAGGKHALETKRKQSPVFHKKLGRIAMERTPHLRKEDDASRHRAEDVVIGWAAAYWAANKVASVFDVKAERERTPAKIMTEAARKPTHDIGGYAADRARAMNDFATMPARIADITKVTISAAQKS